MVEGKYEQHLGLNGHNGIKQLKPKLLKCYEVVVGGVVKENMFLILKRHMQN